MTQGSKDFPTLAVGVGELLFVVLMAVVLVVLGKKFYDKQEALRAQQAQMNAQAPQDPLPPA